MLATIRGMSSRGRRILARWTVFGTLGCMAFAVLFNFILFRDLEQPALGRSIFSGAVIPVLLAGPLFFFLTLKLRELAIANHRLAALASTDSLTGLSNRGAFAAEVETRLVGQQGGYAMPSGALLVIDADNFKNVNDRYGHVCGDEALRCIAAAIRSATRRDDVVGRLGGEEFGVYLADGESAAEVAERIRMAVQAVRFAPRGRTCDLSVSIGGAEAGPRSTFADLYREADARLYEAKRAGRNRVVMATLSRDLREPAPFLLH